MSIFSNQPNHSELYSSSSSQRRSRTHTHTHSSGQQPHSHRTAHSPSRSASASSASASASASSSLIFNKEEDISVPARRTSGLAAALHASRSRREHSVSRSVSADPYSGWSTRGRGGAEDEDEQAVQQLQESPTHAVQGSGVVEVAHGPPVGDAALPCSLRVFIHRSITGSIAASSHKHKHSISSSASSSPPSVSSSSSCSSINSSGSSLASILFHINEPCSLARLKCEIISACTTAPPSSPSHTTTPTSTVDVLSLSKHFDVVAASSSGSADEECPPLSPYQSVHQFGVEALLFVLRATDEAICWWQWRLPQDERWIGPRVLQPPAEMRLLQAARDGDVDSVRALLDSGTSVDAVDDSDGACTALHHAASCGHTALIHMLCKRSADVDRRDGSGRTPLHCAVHANHVDCAETLMLWGANVWIEDGRGRNVMVAARESGHRELIEMIADLMEDGQQETTQLDAQLDAQEWQ